MKAADSFLIPHQDAPAHSLPVYLTTKESLERWKHQQPPYVLQWLESNGFKPSENTTLLLPSDKGELSGVLHHISDEIDLWSIAGLPTSLPSNTYHLVFDYDTETDNALALGWLLGCYSFDRYKENTSTPATLIAPESCHREHVLSMARAIYLVRDLINTPAEDMGPSHLADAAVAMCKNHDAEVSIIVGDDLLTENYPAVHAVGRAATNAPRLIDIRWGSESNPLVTLVGKGICFDSGGLDIKPSSGMLLMKKDMGGAAHVLGLAQLIMDTHLPIRLRVLIPAAENAISGNAFRPGDILSSRKGITIEVGNTDAEGRLVLCDALAEAERESPDMIIDCATLTGAARVALGTDIPAVFSNHDSLAAELVSISHKQNDPLWQLPLWKGYRKQLDSKVADISHVSNSGFGGAITAALFLNEFVSTERQWLHLDMMAWNTAAKSGRPVGGEAMGLRALYQLLLEKYAK